MYLNFLSFGFWFGRASPFRGLGLGFGRVGRSASYGNIEVESLAYFHLVADKGRDKFQSTLVLDASDCPHLSQYGFGRPELLDGATEWSLGRIEVL